MPRSILLWKTWYLLGMKNLTPQQDDCRRSIRHPSLPTEYLMLFALALALYVIGNQDKGQQVTPISPVPLDSCQPSP